MKLELRDVTIAIGARALCRRLDLIVEPGEFWCVLGRNGCGKTTLLRAVAGLRKPDGGEILLGERPLRNWNWRRLAQTRALLPQATRDVFSSTVLETVIAGRFPHRAGGIFSMRGASGSPGKTGDEALAGACLAELRIDDLSGRDVLTLSGGERQRVALAALLAQTPRLALLDEPTTHLDLDVQRIAMDAIARRTTRSNSHGQRSSALVTLHDVNLAQRYASHVLLFLEDGETLAGPRSELLNAGNLSRVYRHPVREICVDEQRWFVAV